MIPSISKHRQTRTRETSHAARLWPTSNEENIGGGKKICRQTEELCFHNSHRPYIYLYPSRIYIQCAITWWNLAFVKDSKVSIHQSRDRWSQRSDQNVQAFHKYFFFNFLFCVVLVVEIVFVTFFSPGILTGTVVYTPSASLARWVHLLFYLQYELTLVFSYQSCCLSNSRQKGSCFNFILASFLWRSSQPVRIALSESQYCCF